MKTFSIASLAALAIVASASPLELAPRNHYCPIDTCRPYPGENKCDITTSCIWTTPSNQYHCACRAGYKADNAADWDTSVQVRTKMWGQEYRVMVKPGVVCNTLCTQGSGANSCQEIRVVESCS